MSSFINSVSMMEVKMTFILVTKFEDANGGISRYYLKRYRALRQRYDKI